MNKKQIFIRGHGRDTPPQNGHCGILTTALLLTSWFITPYAEAQELSARAEGNATGSDQIEEIVVTAQFQRQSIQDTPLAITAITGEAMEAQGLKSVLDVAERVPGVTFTNGGVGGTQTSAVNIRGIGQTDFNLAVEPGVGIYIDDIYYGTVYGSLLRLIDLDRVEILRGPQGTLSGKNSEGGSIKLFSKEPTGSGGGYLEGTYGSYNRREIRGGDDWTLIPDTLFLRLSGIGEKSDGYVKRFDYECSTGNPSVQNFNPGTLGPFSPGGDALNFVPGSVAAGGSPGCQIGADGGIDVTAVRVALRYTPNDYIRDNLAYDATIDHSGPPATVLLGQGTVYGPGYNLLAGTPNLAANFVTSPGKYYNFENYIGLAGTPGQYAFNPENDLNMWGIGNSLTIDLPQSMTLTSISSGRHLEQSSTVDQSPSPLSLAINHWVVDYTQLSQELRLHGSVDRFDWTVGGFYFDYYARQGGRIALDDAVASPIGVPFFVPVDFLFNDPVHSNSKAGFGHFEYRALDNLTLTAGVRYTSDYKRYTYTRQQPYNFAAAVSPAAASTGIETSITDLNVSAAPYRNHRFDYRGTVDYNFVQDVHAYFEYATGFKGGGVNPRPYYLEQIRTFSPETVTSYEVGLKSDLLDHHLRLNVDGFYNNYDDVQLTLFNCPQYVPAGAPPNCYLPDNVGTASIKGAEVESEVRLDGLSIDASASYVDFHYKAVDPAAEVALTFKPPFTPRLKFDVGAQYAIGLGDFGSVTPRADWLYVTEQYASAQNDPLNRIPSYGLLNVHLTYNDPRDSWQVALEGRNVLGKYYFTNLIGGNLATDPNQLQTGFVGPPREFAITIRKNL